MPRSCWARSPASIPDDSATAASRGNSQTDYTQFLDPNGLKGARIGVARKYFGFSDAVDALMEQALDAMKKQGATLVDPADIATLGKFDDTELLVFMYELKADLNAYLARLGANAPVRSLKDIIDFNDRNRQKEMPYFGQDLFLKAEGKGSLADKEYLDAAGQESSTRAGGRHRRAHGASFSSTPSSRPPEARPGSPTWSTAITLVEVVPTQLRSRAIPISTSPLDSSSDFPWEFLFSVAPGANLR